MINIKNTQRRIKLDIPKIKSEIAQILDILKYTDFDIGVWFTSNKTIHEYNFNFRKKDKATDILSFPYHPELIAGKRIKINTDEDKNLGDLMLAPEYIAQDALNLGVNFDDRLRMLLVHGILHLLGYDHITDSDYRKMHAKELAILKKLRI